MGQRADREVVDAGLGDAAARCPGSGRREASRPGPAGRRARPPRPARSGVMLSSRIRSAPGLERLARPGRACRLDLDRQVRVRRPDRANASATPPAATTWLSLTSAASDSDIRWLTPPPQRTAYFSSARRPGVVLRVSRTAAPGARHRVDPRARWRWRRRRGGTSRLSAVRSAVSSVAGRAGDGDQHRRRGSTRSPSVAGRLDRDGPRRRRSNTAAATGRPATTPARAADQVGGRRSARPDGRPTVVTSLAAGQVLGAAPSDDVGHVPAGRAGVGQP